MSRVYFHSPEDDAEVRGSERAYASCLIGNLAMAVFENHVEKYRDEQPLLKIIPAGSYLHRSARERFANDFGTWFRVAYGPDDYFILPDGQKVATWDVALNTATVLGGDALMFLARMHAQCEIHGWVDGPDKAWLAEIIEQGLVDKLYRANAGWETVVELLKENTTSPVVMSYSVCEQFPNCGVGDWMDKIFRDDEHRDEHADKWYELPDDEKWRISMDGLKAKSGKLKIKPDDWRGYGYGLGLSAFDVVAALYDERKADATS